jgi:dynein heavy chain, axonemal
MDIYGVYVNPETYKFEKWEELITEQFEFDPKVSFFDILVPTSDTIKYRFLQMKLLMNGHNVLITGYTGVGKSVITKNFLMNAPENIVSAFLNFSGKTSTKNVVDALEENLKAIKKDRLQPLAGKRMVFFVDDVNMPQLEKFFAQPPCELLRQIIDQGGFYDTKALFFKQVRETSFVAACAPPGGGRNVVTPRLFRHFNMIWVPELTATSMKTIFSSILKGFLQLKGEGNLHSFADMIIKSSVDIYQKTIKDFLPTPAKCHYTFNLRDLSKVVQGILMCDLKRIEDKDYLVKLYMCETFRVFRDRLINQADRNKFSELAHDALTKLP